MDQPQVEMPTMLKEGSASLVRSVLNVVAGYLVAQGIWTDAEATTYVAAAALWFVGYAWSLWQKHQSQLKFLTALQLPAGSTEKDVEVKIAKS